MHWLSQFDKDQHGAYIYDNGKNQIDLIQAFYSFRIRTFSSEIDGAIHLIHNKTVKEATPDLFPGFLLTHPGPGC